MKVKIKQALSYQGDNLNKGDEVDVDDDQAARWEQAGYAVPVEGSTRKIKRKAKKADESE